MKLAFAGERLKMRPMANRSRSAEIRAQLDHPIIDSDGHTIEYEPALWPYVEKIAGRDALERYRKVTGARVENGVEVTFQP